jgi:GTP cyclohydrolase I
MKIKTYYMVNINPKNVCVCVCARLVCILMQGSLNTYKNIYLMKIYNKYVSDSH